LALAADEATCYFFRMESLYQSIIDWIANVTGADGPRVLQLFWTGAVISGYFAFKFAARLVFLKRIKETHERYLANKTTGYVVGFIACAILIRVWVGGISGLAAYLGIMSAGLAIALQEPLVNFAGWIFLMVRRPFTVGDRIEIGSAKGDVIDIRLFQFTLVECGNWVQADQSTGRLIHIPNGWVFRHPQSNYTSEFDFIWDELPVIVTFESNWEKAKEILTEIANEHSPVQSAQAEQEVRSAAEKYMIIFRKLTPIVWTSLHDVGVTLTMRYLCRPRQRRGTQTKIAQDMLTAFAQHDDIDFAYPTVRYYDNVREGKPGARAQ